MRITREALKHGVSEEQIGHGLQVPMRTVAPYDTQLLVIGADRAGRLLEMGDRRP